MKVKILLLLLLLFCGCVQEQQNQIPTTISTSFEKIVQVLRAWGDYDIYALTEENNEYFGRLLAVGMKVPKGSSGDDLKEQILAGFAAMYVVDKTYDAYAVEITGDTTKDVNTSMIFIVEKKYLEQYSNKKISYEEFKGRWHVQSNIEEKYLKDIIIKPEDSNSKNTEQEIENGLKKNLQNKGYDIESLKACIDEEEVATTCPQVSSKGKECIEKKTIFAINLDCILSDNMEDEKMVECMNEVLSLLYDEYPTFYRCHVNVKSDEKEFEIDVERTDFKKYLYWEITLKELYSIGHISKKGFKETEMDRINSALGSCDVDVVYANTGKLRLFAPELSDEDMMECMKKAVESLYDIYLETEQAVILVKTNKGRTTTLYLTQGKGESIEKIISKESDGYSVKISCYDGDPIYGGHGRCYDSDIQAELNTAW